jgi:hypothetical protein
VYQQSNQSIIALLVAGHSAGRGDAEYQGEAHLAEDNSSQ